MKTMYLKRLFKHLFVFQKISLHREALHFCLDTKTKQKGQGLGNSPKMESNFLNISQTLHLLDLFLTKIRFSFLTVNHPRPILKPRSLIQASDRNKQNLTIQNNVAFKTFAKEQEGRSTVAKVFSDEFLDTFYGEKVSCLDGIESNWKLSKTFPLPLARAIALLVSLLFSYLTVPPAYGQEPVGLGVEDTSKKGNSPAELAIASMLQQKKEYKIEHDFKKPFVAHGNGVESESVIFQSVLTGYQKGHKGQMIRPTQPFIDGKLSINKGTSYRLGCYNTTLKNLYSEAFIHGRRVLPRNRVVLEVRDPSKLTSDLKGAKYVEWLEANGYCYELIMPAAVGRAAVYTQMQHDLARMFPQYTASIQQRKIESYALVRTSKKDKLKTKGGKPAGAWDHFGFSMQNYYGLDYFLQQLEYYLQKELPLINKTGYNEKIDIDLKTNLSSIEELNKALAAYDLQLVRGWHTMDVLVISDSGREAIEFHSNPADYSDRPRNFDWQPLKQGGI